MRGADWDEEDPEDAAFKRWTEVKTPGETKKAGLRREGEWHDAILLFCTWVDYWLRGLQTGHPGRCCIS